MFNNKQSIELNNSLNEREESLLINKAKSSNINEYHGKRIKISPAVLAMYNKFKQEYIEQNNNMTTEPGVVLHETYSKKKNELRDDRLCENNLQYDQIFRSKSTNNMKVLDMPPLKVAQEAMLNNFDLMDTGIHIEENSSDSIIKRIPADSSRRDKQTSVTTLRKHSLADKQTSVTTLLNNYEVKKCSTLCAVKEIDGATSFKESVTNCQYRHNGHHVKVQKIYDNPLVNGNTFPNTAQFTNTSKPLKGDSDELKESNISRFRSRSCISNVDGGVSSNKKQFRCIRINNRKFKFTFNTRNSDESNQDDTLPDALTTTLRHLRPRERSPLIEGFQRENSNLYVVPEIDEYLAEEESDESKKSKVTLNNVVNIEDASAETLTISSTGSFIYNKALASKGSQMKINGDNEGWQIASKKFAAQIADVFKRDAEQWLEEMKGEISLSKLIATTEEIEATNAIDAAFSDNTDEDTCKRAFHAENHSMKFRKAKSNTVSSIATTSTDVQSLPPKIRIMKSKQKKQKHVSPLDSIELLNSPRRTSHQQAIEVNVAALSKIFIKCPDSACKRNMKLPHFGWHMAVEHFSTLKMDYLAPNEVGHLNILVANVCWATRRPIKLFMLKNMVVDIGCRFYNKYLPIVAMVRPVHCNEIYNRPIFGEPLTEEYLMIWFTGITLKARPLSIELTLRNGDTLVTKTVGLYSIKKNQCLIDVYVSGNAILVTHELITKLTRGENLILRGEIVVR